MGVLGKSLVLWVLGVPAGILFVLWLVGVLR
jgi:hypothetical protein